MGGVLRRLLIQVLMKFILARYDHSCQIESVYGNAQKGTKTYTDAR